jgi:hypothetical protein
MPGSPVYNGEFRRKTRALPCLMDREALLASQVNAYPLIKLMCDATHTHLPS